MSDTVDELKRMILDQQNKLERLEKQVKEAEKQAEAAERYSRQDCLILRGKLDMRPNGKLRDEVMRLIEYHTGVRFPSWCMNTVHWLGGGSSLIVRFNNKGVRDEIYRNRIPKHADRRGLFIHESLTPAKMSLVTRCAGLRKEGKLTTYYTQGGHVLVKGSKEAPSVLVSPDMTNEEIMTMLETQPKSYREAAAQPQRKEVSTEQKNQEEGVKQGEKEGPDTTKEVIKETETKPTQKQTSQKEPSNTDDTDTTDVKNQSHCTAEASPATHIPNSDDDEVKEGQTDSEQNPQKVESKKAGKTDKHKATDGEGAAASGSGSDQGSDATSLSSQPSKEPKDGSSKPDRSRSPSHSPQKRTSKRRRNKQKGN